MPEAKPPLLVPSNRFGDEPGRKKTGCELIIKLVTICRFVVRISFPFWLGTGITSVLAAKLADWVKMFVSGLKTMIFVIGWPGPFVIVIVGKKMFVKMLVEYIKR